MNARHPSDAWIDANQRLMVAEFGRLKQRLGAEGDGETIAPPVESAPTAWQRLMVTLFGRPKQAAGR